MEVKSGEGASLPTSKAFLRKLLDRIPVTMAILNPDGTILEVNQGWREFADSEGLEWENYGIGRKYTEGLKEGTDPKFITALRKILSEERQIYSEEYPCHSPDEKRWFHLTIKPVEHDDNRYVAAIHVNVTERRLAQNRRDFLHSLLRNDVLNRLNVVQGYLDLLGKNLENGDLQEAQKNLEKSTDAAQDQIDLVQKIQTLVKIDEETTKPTQLKNSVQKAIKALRDEANDKNIQITDQTEERQVAAGPLLTEMLKNLIQNAIKHSGATQIQIRSQFQNDEYILTVEDDGKGIPEKDRNKALQKEETLGETGGTGLGLHLIKRITENYGGTIEITDSELGGAQFTIHLPQP